MRVVENYLDPDMAYVLGLIVARGTLLSASGGNRIIIEFPFKNLEAVGLTSSYNQEQQLHYSLNQIRERIVEIAETDVSVNVDSHIARLEIRFLRSSIFWRNVNHLLKGETKFHNFEIPEAIFDSEDIDVQKEFVRGIADCAGFIRQSNNYMNGKRRVYIEVANRNWLLPIQLCYLLQQRLDVPVQCIQWGHPNTREPRKLKKRHTWAREHQVKIFSEAFVPIGFHVEYKDIILREFAESDRSIYGNIRHCNPNPSIRRIRKKPKHPGEKSKKLPPSIRGKHFDATWEICLALGCEQKKDVPQLELEFDEDETNLEGE